MPAISLSGQTRQRQIVILAVGGVLLGGLLLFQVPRTLKMLEGSSAPAPRQQQPSQTTPAPTPVSPTTTPGSPPVTVGSEGSSPQHAALTRFTSKDPFVQQVGDTGAAASPSGGSTSSSEPNSAAPAGSETGSESAAFTAGTSEAAAAGTATIAVNGAEETVSVDGTFPEGNPVFKLVSLSGDTAKVGVASGKLKGGAQTVTLNQGEPLTLLNTVDGKRYRLELVAVTE
jgi:hypothetical protein